MRSLVLSAIAASIFFFTHNAFAQDRYCSGSCDDYITDENYRDIEPQLPDESGFGNDTMVGGPLYVDEPAYRMSRYGRIRPERIRPERRRFHQSRYERRQNRSMRRYKSRRRHREVVQPPIFQDTFTGRTEFCRTTSEKRGRGWFKKRVNVRRCVWVRNDLVPNHANRNASWNLQNTYSN